MLKFLPDLARKSSKMGRFWPNLVLANATSGSRDRLIAGQAGWSEATYTPFHFYPHCVDFVEKTISRLPFFSTPGHTVVHSVPRMAKYGKN